MEEKPFLLIIGNSNVGKSSITKLLLKDASKYKGKIGKKPGSTLLIKPITQKNMSYQIVDLPGFGFSKSSSQRREKHIKNQIVTHIEKNNEKYFYGLIVLNILRIEDELKKYHYKNTVTIPLSFELISFLREFSIPLLIMINKIDKVTTLYKKKIINLFITTAKQYDLNVVSNNDYNLHNLDEIPYLEFSALKKLNLGILKNNLNLFLKN
ncbi:MAG: 50S ribosome-binding GTPase [Candidatus Lokiarchaeota archaeon]|nr:50S ribosome-binding GTPase [Candidatus Lokiarchaeota archaeon]